MSKECMKNERFTVEDYQVRAVVVAWRAFKEKHPEYHHTEWVEKSALELYEDLDLLEELVFPK